MTSKLKYTLFAIALIFAFPVAGRADEKPITTAILQQPAYFPPSLAPAVNFAQKGEYSKAVKQIDKALATFKRLAGKDRVYFLGGICQQLLGDHERAVQFFQESLSYRRANSDTLFFLAVSEQARGRLLEALDALDEAVWFARHTFVPAPLVQLRRGLLYRTQGDNVKAHEALNAAVADPADASAALTLSDIAREQGNRVDALRWAQEALARSPNSREGQLRMAQGLLLGLDRNLDRESVDTARSLSSAILADPGTKPETALAAYKAAILGALAASDFPAAGKLLAGSRQAFPNDLDLPRLEQQLAVERESAGAGTPPAGPSPGNK